ncbi:hypothetical protein PFUGPA_03429 [Plasmodium falciparum Palo Alto/Uganda]|uniref:Uncharacterized protein n=1 Tax=Plasmodium falciparum (isolate Palo Alto / Uganda) TaxID=57270 RepID=W4IZL2_PLAFP|nr:hypothetical protein PFUGPA_03429 [Plasmodium falciparum Palo Alto/Uganda]
MFIYLFLFPFQYIYVKKLLKLNKFLHSCNINMLQLVLC